MDRRTYLRSLGAATATVSTAATAGCLGGLGGLGDSGAEGTILGPPERDLSEASHPSYGDEMPHIAVPDPITGETVSTEGLEGERAVLWTSFYTNCPDGVCPALILRLRRAQEYAAEQGVGDEAAFLSLTFDPEQDTAEVLREYADQRGVDLDAGNWHFLRPESYERGRELMDEQFGLMIEKRDADEHENLEYQFPHVGIILLANKDGIVERVYPRGPQTDIERLVDDFERVVTA
ncbi:electron transporter SCO1/SenC [Halorubrum aidingense JCM 13560]|uniref:Electron transporter SCO1/SenC n=1 Tax=Halorubrum aidingense JCM 13560 TaxID=1230454 RepID=M0PDR7_9EURY|nr:SCO family protein [Halorubrum aidingense]EMA67679.1 electron transporter SCO1/SenC [Halorubrum aidingense JCM 13560]